MSRMTKQYAVLHDQYGYDRERRSNWRPVMVYRITFRPADAATYPVTNDTLGRWQVADLYAIAKRQDGAKAADLAATLQLMVGHNLMRQTRHSALCIVDADEAHYLGYRLERFHTYGSVMAGSAFKLGLGGYTDLAHGMTDERGDPVTVLVLR